MLILDLNFDARRASKKLVIPEGIWCFPVSAIFFPLSDNANHRLAPMPF